MEIVRKKLTQDEIIAPTLRYDTTCSCIQRTNDGGGTWVDAPGSDPRHDPSFRAPVRAGGADPRCDAAANLTAYLKKAIHDTMTPTTTTTAATVLFDAVLLLGEFGVVVDLVSIVVEGLFAIGQSVVNAAMTDAVYAQLQCIFDLDISTDGSISAAQLTAIESDVAAQIGGTAETVLNLVFGLTGEVGLSNAGAHGTLTGDCTSCGLPAWQFFPASDYTDGHRGRCVSGQWLSSDVNYTGIGTTASSEIMMRVLLPPCTLESVTITFTKTSSSFAAGPTTPDQLIYDSGNGWYDGAVLESALASTNLGATWAWAGSQAITTELTIWMFAALNFHNTFGTIVITRVDIETSVGSYVYEHC